MLYEFYGEECPHCMRMRELTTTLMKEFPTVEIVRKEVWHDKRNMAFIKECDKGDDCGGVPFFFNSENKKWLCGEVTYDELKSWAGVV
jgi:thiol-disulfide isomerase/thioredoxin